MAAAYAYAENSDKNPPPDEWILLNYLDRFGAKAVLGREPSAEEMRRMVLVENVVESYRSKKRAANKGQWVKDNPDRYKILQEAYQAWQTQR